MRPVGRNANGTRGYTKNFPELKQNIFGGFPLFPLSPVGKEITVPFAGARRDAYNLINQEIPEEELIE